MTELFLNLSKYIMIFLMAVYTLESFMVFSRRNNRSKNALYFRQIIIILLLHSTGMVTLGLQKNNQDYWFLYLLQVIIIFAIVALFQMIYPKINRLLMNNMCMLLTVGFIILARLSYDKALKQFMILMVSITIALMVPFFIQKIKLFKRLTWVYGIVGIFALSTVLLVGVVTNGSNISYSIGGVTFQPSEFVKILFVFFIAGLLKGADNFYKLMISAVMAGIHVIILVLSRDLGAALIFYVVYFIMVYIATKKSYYLVVGLVAGAIAAYLAYRLFGHVQVRVEVWLDPWADINETGFQITQSLFAIGTGGWFGLGLLQGTPNSIPLVETDFVFSAIVEEMGVIFGLLVIMVCLSSCIMIMNIASLLQNKFYQLVVIGLGVTYGFQVFLIIGGGIKLIPLTGVTLPFISYGGSSMLSSLIMFSIIQGIYITRKEKLEAIENKRRIIEKKRKDIARKREQQSAEYRNQEY